MKELEAGKPIPPAVAWRVLFVTGCIAVLAGLSMQAHSLTASDLGGALGLSADEASWVLTAGAAAEGAAVLIAAPAVSMFGVRRTILCALALTEAFAIASQVFPSWLLPIRCAGALACGMLSVPMMGWSMRAFAPPKRGLPLTLFAFATSFPTALAALLAGTATGHWGGAGVFVWDLLWPLLALLLAFLTLPNEPMQLRTVISFDWLGYFVFTSGVVIVLIWFSQGERRFWFETSWMAPLITVGIVLLALGTARLITAANPFLDASLLAKPTFAIGLTEAVSLRFGLLMASFAVPQALARLQGFRPEQAGQTVIWLAVGQVVGFSLAFLWLDRKDGRYSLAVGLATFALAAFQAAFIDSSWQGDQFRNLLILAGFGQGLFLTSVLAFATWGVPATAGATAAGLFNLSRVLGTAGAAAAVGYFLRIRENGHSVQLVEGLANRSEAWDMRLGQLLQAYNSITTDAGAAQSAATSAIATQVSKQAFTLAFADVFFAIAVILAASVLLVTLLPPLPPFSVQANPEHPT